MDGVLQHGGVLGMQGALTHFDGRRRTDGAAMDSELGRTRDDLVLVPAHEMWKKAWDCLSRMRSLPRGVGVGDTCFAVEVRKGRRAERRFTFSARGWDARATDGQLGATESGNVVDLLYAILSYYLVAWEQAARRGASRFVVDSFYALDLEAIYDALRGVDNGRLVADYAWALGFFHSVRFGLFQCGSWADDAGVRSRAWLLDPGVFAWLPQEMEVEEQGRRGL